MRAFPFELPALLVAAGAGRCGLRRRRGRTTDCCAFVGRRCRRRRSRFMHNRRARGQDRSDEREHRRENDQFLHNFVLMLQDLNREAVTR